MSYALGLLPDRHDPRDAYYPLPVKLAPLPPLVNLRPGCSPIRDQQNLGSCTAFALAAGLREFLTPALVPLSPLWLYWFERKREHTIPQDSGARLRDGLKVMRNMGVAPEVDWPYNPVQFEVTPSGKSVHDATAAKIIGFTRLLTLVDVRHALATNHPVVIGIQVFDSFLAATDGTIPMPNFDTEQLQGGHAICLVGYDDAAQVVNFRNSWGTTWGDQGYGTLPYAYLDPAEQLVMDMWSATV